WVFSWAGSHGSSCSHSSSGTRQLSAGSLTPIALPAVVPSGYRRYSPQRVIRTGSKDHRKDLLVMAFQDGPFLARDRIPQPDREVPTSGRKHLAIGGKGH